MRWNPRVHSSLKRSPVFTPEADVSRWQSVLRDCGSECRSKRRSDCCLHPRKDVRMSLIQHRSFTSRHCILGVQRTTFSSVKARQARKTAKTGALFGDRARERSPTVRSSHPSGLRFAPFLARRITNTSRSVLAPALRIASSFCSFVGVGPPKTCLEARGGFRVELRGLSWSLVDLLSFWNERDLLPVSVGRGECTGEAAPGSNLPRSVCRAGG